MKLLLLVLIFVATPNSQWTERQIYDAYRYTIQATDYWRDRGQLDVRFSGIDAVAKDDFPHIIPYSIEVLYYRFNARKEMTFYWTKECTAYNYDGDQVLGWTYTYEQVVVKYCGNYLDEFVPVHELGHWAGYDEAELAIQLSDYEMWTWQDWNAKH